MDAEAALCFVTQCLSIPAHRVVLHGLSIGAALAVAIGEQHPEVHLTLDQAFTNAGDVARFIVNSKVTRVLVGRQGGSP